MEGTTLRRMLWGSRVRASRRHEPLSMRKTHWWRGIGLIVGLFALSLTVIPALVAAGAFCILFLPFIIPFAFVGMKGQGFPPPPGEEPSEETKWLHPWPHPDAHLDH